MQPLEAIYDRLTELQRDIEKLMDTHENPTEAYELWEISKKLNSIRFCMPLKIEYKNQKEKEIL